MDTPAHLFLRLDEEVASLIEQRIPLPPAGDSRGNSMNGSAEYEENEEINV